MASTLTKREEAEAWTAAEVPQGEIEIRDQKVGAIALVAPVYGPDGLTEDDRSRARLMAAAPYLKAALEELLEAVSGTDLEGEIDAGCDGQGPVERARSALAKARGEQE